MLVNHLIISNSEEIIRADNLGIAIPKAVFVKRQMCLNINDIFNARITKENNIDLVLTDGFSYEIEYNEVIWESIIRTINEREKSR
jgi:ATP:corrinoid adenosyltransferase